MKVDDFIQRAKANGSISSVQGAANEYAAWKQARADWIEQEEAADATFLQEMLTAQQPPASTFDPAKWKQQDYAESARWEQQQVYQRYRQDKWADLPPEKKSFWKQAKDWLQDKKVEKFVYHPPSWLSVLYRVCRAGGYFWSRRGKSSSAREPKNHEETPASASSW